MSKPKFSERYVPGETLRLVGADDETVTTGLVLEYEKFSKFRKLEIALVAGVRQYNNWHIALMDPSTEGWWPAAIWEGQPEKDGLGSHINARQEILDERYRMTCPEHRRYLAFTVQEMLDAVNPIIAQTVAVERIDGPVTEA
jgi:hypothetical protein